MRSSRVNKPGWKATVFGTKKKFLVFRRFQLLSYFNNFLECTIFLTCSYRDNRSDFVVGRIRILFDKTKSFPSNDVFFIRPCHRRFRRLAQRGINSSREVDRNGGKCWVTRMGGSEFFWSAIATALRIISPAK